MPKETKIKYKDFHKTVGKIIAANGRTHRYINKSGSARRFEQFDEKGKLINFWVVHESKKIYTEDLKKTCSALGVNIEEFTERLN